jgi:hypothetical protein
VRSDFPSGCAVNASARDFLLYARIRGCRGNSRTVAEGGASWSALRNSSREVGGHLTVQSPTLPEPLSQIQGSGSIPIRSLTADRIRCLQPNYHSAV